VLDPKVLELRKGKKKRTAQCEGKRPDQKGGQPKGVLQTLDQGKEGGKPDAAMGEPGGMKNVPRSCHSRRGGVGGRRSHATNKMTKLKWGWGGEIKRLKKQPNCGTFITGEDTGYTCGGGARANEQSQKGGWGTEGEEGRPQRRLKRNKRRSGKNTQSAA